MKTRSRLRHYFTLCASLAGLSLALSTTSAWAANVDVGAFELEGNAVQDGAARDDWETLYNGGANNGGSPTKFTGILDDVPTAAGDPSVFTGGRKDIQDISDWGHKTGSSPDKDEITNAYAAAYDVGGDLHVYFGADRISNTGDAFMGFWFFKKPLIALADGSFQGEHSNGDVLALVNFPQASGASPEISVAVWDTDCPRALNNNPQVDQCVATNLRLKFKGAAVCGGAGVTTACAITNSEDGPFDPTASPWEYKSKNDATANRFPYETFFEGGINLTQLVGGDSCFSSFLAETRSSSSFTATLKDFRAGDFELCSVKITKDCGAGEINSTDNGFVFEYEGEVENDGSGTLYDVTVVDNNGTPLVASDDITHAIGTLTKGEKAPYSGLINSTLNPPTNTVVVTAAARSGAEATITDTATDECERVDRDPFISVTKECSTEIIEKNGELVVQVNFLGQVCNTSVTSGGAANAITLENVTVRDDSGTPDDTTDDKDVLGPVTLYAYDNGDKKACQPYSGSYIPGAPAGLPHDLSFTDTVRASGVAILNFGTAEETASATCPLCPDPAP